MDGTVVDDAPTSSELSSRGNASMQTEVATSIVPSQSENYSIIKTGTRKIVKKFQKARLVDEVVDEPLIDITVALPKNSKKTRRLQKQHEKREMKASSKIRTFLELPREILHEILGHLRPSDVLRIAQLNHATRDFIQQHQTSIAKDIITRRYRVLNLCFPLPKLLHEVDQISQAALFHPRREKMTEVHKKPYQHIRPPDSQCLCTCSACLLAWNNLNVVLDLAHFQDSLNRREPIPMLPRGVQPEWNTALITGHALIVKRAMTNPLTYAAILEKHLDTIIGTLLRQTRLPRQKPQPLHRHNKVAAPAAPLKSVHVDMPYNFKETLDAAAQDDRFLERFGKESYEFPWHRDNYYSIVAYVPNRKWSKVEQRWIYYAAGAHERDLEWVRKWFLPASAV